MLSIKETNEYDNWQIDIKHNENLNVFYFPKYPIHFPKNKEDIIDPNGSKDKIDP